MPSSWRWVRLETVGKIVGGGTPRSDNPTYFTNDGVPWLTPADLNGFKEKRITRGRRCITQAGLENSSAQLLPAGTVLFSSRAPIGYVAVAGTQLTTNQGFKSCIPFVEETNEFLYYFLLSAAKRIDSEASGTTFREVSGKIVGQIPVPLPPLAEQKRIVAKLDELMALCDRLEVREKERKERHVALCRAAVACFDEAPTPANLSLLFHDSYSIAPADLRTAILSLAVQGKIVPQDSTGATASDELEAINSKKNELVREGLIKKSAPSRTISADEADHEVPDSWTWVRLGDITELITDGTHQTPKYTDAGRVFLSAQNVKPFRFMPEKHRFVSEDDYQGYIKNRKPEKGDILLTRVGAGIGEAAVIDRDLDFAIYVSLGLIRPVRGYVSSEYLTMWLNSPDGTSKSSRNTYGKGVSQGNLNLSLIRSFLVPLPPLREQWQIVNRVNQLIPLVDRLEMQLAASDAAARKLLDAVVHELLHPSAKVVELPSSGRDRIMDRAAIGCYVIQRLAQGPNFGRTMNMKIGYLAETHLGLSLGWRPERQAAGPWDPWISEFDSMGRREGWFVVTEKSLGNGRSKFDYVPKPALKETAAEAVTVLGKQKAEFDRMLSLFAERTTEEAEIIATLFAAWNDFLIDGKSPTDEEIIREVRENWHESKQRFTPSLLVTWLKWLRSNQLVPQGCPPRTKQQLRFAM